MKLKLNVMKKTILSVFFVLMLVVNGFAVDKNKTDKKETASYFAQNNFNAKFHDAKEVTWSNVDGYFKATFTLNGVKKAAFFNAQGDYVATTEYIKADKLPEAALEKLKKVYKDYTIGEVLRFELDETSDSALYSTAGETAYYFASLRKEDRQIVVKISSQNDISFFRSL